MAASSEGRPQLTIIADDLTGSLDTGVMFADRGFETFVFVTQSTERPTAEVIVYDSESREDSVREAMRKIRALAGPLRGLCLYKKIDSTMRGNIGYELRALLETTAAQAVVVAPAFPQGGRTTLHGVHYVNGRPLALTAFREDPRWPMRESHLPTLLMQQAGMEIGLLEQEIVHQGVQAVIKALQNDPHRIIVADAFSDQDLEIIAKAVYRLGPRWIPCGSAGLAKAWAALLRPSSPSLPPPPFRPQGRGILFVCASRNPLTRSQMERLLGMKIPHFPLEAASSYDEENEIQRLIQLVRPALHCKREAVIEACTLPFQPGGSERIARILGRVTREMADETLLGGLFLTGGDIARSTCLHLGAKALRIIEEIQPGVPGAMLANGPFKGLAIVTKAGGLGNEKAMIDAREWLCRRIQTSFGNDSRSNLTEKENL